MKKEHKVIEARADRLMRHIDQAIGEPTTEWNNSNRIAILGALLERIELAIEEAKERTF